MEGKTLRIGEIEKRITYCAFTYMLGHIITKEQEPEECPLNSVELEPRKDICTH